MKKNLLIIMLVLLTAGLTFGQLTGTKYIPGTDVNQYPTLAAAIADLNLQGAGPGGVTFNIATGYTETFTSASAGYITTLSGSAANPIIFQRFGEGSNPVITAPTGTGTMDAIIAVNGCDYITFDGIDLLENAANTIVATQMEWGYALLKATETNGSQNITIRNCTISLNKANTSTAGIYSNNHTSALTTQLVLTSAAGSNSNLRIYGNTINNSYSGIFISGFADPNSPYAYYDQNNEIGKDGANQVSNVAGQTATPAVAGYGIYCKAQNNLKVANNSIVAAMSGNGSPSAIYLTGATNASADIYGNYVSMQFSGTGTVQINGIFSDMGASGTNSSMNIYNNTITGCTYPTMTSGAAYMMNFTNMATNIAVYGNTISNNTLGASGVTATGTIRYLYVNASPTTTGLYEVHDNIVSGNVRTQITVGAGGTNLIYVSGKSSVFNMYNNQVTNNVLGSNGTAYCLYAGADIAASNIYDNIVSNISKAEGTTYGLNVYNVTASTPPLKAYRNTITNIEGLTASAVIYGLYSASSNTIYFFNNMVSDLRATATNGTTSSPDRIYGCYISSTAYAGIYNNSIFINNSSTGANFGSVALFSSSSGTKMDLRNNIFINTSTPSGTTARTMVVKFNYTSLTNFSSLSNYNNLYAGTPGATRVIFYNGTTAYQSLTDYKTLVSPRELQSVTEMPPFVNTTVGSMNLHLLTSVPTQCESGGFTISTPVALNMDADNNPRFPNAGYPVNGSFSPNAPDIGADEFGGLSNDITGPSITYTPLQNTYLTTNRTLTATITDGTGVPTSGAGLPVLYWKINSGSYQSAQGIWTSGSSYDFSFGTGSTVGDIVSYYIVAQDLAAVPNVSSYPWVGAAGYTADPPSVGTAPLPPATFTILAGISGTYHVGVGKDYETITAAAYDISTKFINGPLTLMLDDATYPTETFPVTFVANPGSSASNILTIRPNDNQNVAISAASATGILDLSGVDYVVIDGSSKGTDTRDLIIENTSTVFNVWTVRFTNSGGNDPVTNLTVKNCIIRVKPKHASGGPAAIIIPNSGGGHENIIFENNQICSTFDAFYLRGISGNPIRNFQIINNTIGSTIDSLSVTHMGVYLEYADNTLISNNEIMGPPSGSYNTGQTGVYIGAGCTSTKVRKNKIHTFWRYSDDGWGATGLWFAAADATTVTEISNNVIYDIHSPGINGGVGQNITYGMFFRSGGNVKILHNSINLTGQLSTQYDASSSCLGFYYQATGGNFEVRNNILKNSMNPIGVNTYGKPYGIMISLNPGSMFSTINNNDYFINGNTGMIAQQYTNGTGIVVNYATLADWQAYCGQEANSITVDPVFASETSLIPTSTAMNNAGSYIPAVNTDITGKVRSNPPDMGAYEFANDPVVVTGAANTISYSTATLTGMVNAKDFTVNSYFDFGTTSAYGSSIAGTPATITGSTNTAISVNLSGLLPSTTYHFRARGVTTTGLIMYGDDMTFTTDAASLVTFNVDMSTAAGFTPGSDLVYIAGNFPGASWNEPGTNPALQLSQVGVTLTYTLTMAIPDGTYEYKYFKNAGWGGGEWNGGSNRSAAIAGIATINDTWGGSINWANLQWPGTGAIDLGSSYDVYMQAYIPNGITAAAGSTYGLQAWIGYSTSNTDPSTWTNWIPAPYFGQSGDNDEFKTDLGSALTTAGTYYYASRFQFGNDSYIYGGFNGGFWNGTTNVSGILTVNETIKTLNLNVLLEGLYDTDGTMRKAQDENGDHFTGTTADQITVELHDGTTYGTVIYTASDVNLSTSGSCTVSVPAAFNGNYYITIIHRNSIVTTTSAPVSFASGTITYSFDAAAKAYGNNLLQIGSYYVIYGGDVNMDSVVDATDMISVDNDSAAFAAGYINSDVNGDGLVDSGDMILVDNNSSLFAGSILP